MKEAREMENAEEQGTIDQSGDHNGDHSEYEMVVEELMALRELEGLKRFLKVENLKLKNQVEMCAGELAGIAISMSEVETTMDSYEAETKKCETDEEIIKLKKDALIQDISEHHLKIKVAKEDDASCARLIEALKDDLVDVIAQKEEAIKRLKDIKAGIQRIDSDKNLRMPRLRGYDSVLKQLHTTFRGSQDRMEISRMLKQK
jgi:chromosome segregation ATPase